jgi:Bacterial capsule synthesis protein PGA_cap
MGGGWRLLAVLLIACLPIAVTAPGPFAATVSPRAQPNQVATQAPTQAPTASPGPTPPSAPQRQRVTIALTGDVLPHNTVWSAAETGDGFDFGPILAPLAPTIRAADLALCHLEVPLAAATGPFSSYPRFSAPPQLAEALVATGYDGCSTASNHSVDQGHPGVVRTLRTLDVVGLEHTGTARSSRESERIVSFERDGLRIAWLSYTYGTNGLPVDADKPWSVNLIDPARIRSDARRARRDGADAVLVALHWGSEYRHSPDAYQEQVARVLARAPAITLIYGHHAHVVQPIRRVGGTWVIYGLGNSVADQRATAPGVDTGLIAEVTLVRVGDGAVRVRPPTYRPTYIDTSLPSGLRVYDVLRRLAKNRLSADDRVELERARDYVNAVMEQ